MTEATKFGVRVFYDHGRFDDFDLLKSPPSKVVVYQWDYPDDDSPGVLVIREITDITPVAFYELFLPTEDRVTGVELHSPNGHRFYINRHIVTNLALVPIMDEPVS